MRGLFIFLVTSVLYEATLCDTASNVSSLTTSGLCSLIEQGRTHPEQLKETQMSRNALTLILLVAFSILGGSSVAQAADDSAAKYQIYTFNKPPHFGTLEDYIHHTNGESLDEAALIHLNVNGRSAIIYWTRVDGVRAVNLLIDDNISLHLMTAARIGVMHDEATRSVSFDDWGSALRPLLSIGGIIPSSCGSVANSRTSTAYIRCLAPWLPTKELTLFTAKSIINSQIPHLGAVAVIQTCDTWTISGHLAYIIGVNNDSNGEIRTISIAEANIDPSPGFDIRTDTPIRLGIVGYIVQR